MIKTGWKCYYSEDYQHGSGIFQGLKSRVTERKKKMSGRIYFPAVYHQLRRVGNTCLNPIVNFYILSTCHRRTAVVYASMRQLIITSRRVATGVWDTKYNHKAETYLQTYCNTLFIPVITNMMTVFGLSSEPLLKPKQWMFVIQFLSVRPPTIFFMSFSNIRQASNSVIFYSLCSGALVLTTLCSYRRLTRIYIRHLSLRSKEKAEQGESICRGKRQRREELRPARALLPSCALELACQRSRINPLPGTPARITGHNHMWQPAHEPVIRMAPAPAQCKSRAIVTVWFQVTVSLLTWNAPLSSMKNAHAKCFTQSGWVARGLCSSARALDWLSGEISERNVHHVISHKKDFKVICVLLAPSTPSIKVHLQWWNCYWKTADRGVNTVFEKHCGKTGTLSPSKGRVRIKRHFGGHGGM